MYKVIVSKFVFKELYKINKNDQRLILNKIGDFENGNFTSDKSLKGKYHSKFRKRAGTYRIVYFKENDILLITVIRIAHRKEVY